MQIRRLFMHAVLAAAAMAATQARAQAPLANDGEWPMAARDYASTRFSPLDQVNAANVGKLKVAFTFDTGVDRGQEAAPIVVGNTMYLVAPFPNYLYALDLSKPGAPMKWKFEPNPDARSQGVACCDLVNRGVAYADGRIFMNTLDGQTIAVDAASGKEIWRTKLGDIKKGETITMAPLVVKDKVLVGNSGGELGVRAGRPRHPQRQGGLARMEHGSGQRSPDRRRLQALLCIRSRQGSRQDQLAG
jgi:glucose dehydrogenase